MLWFEERVADWLGDAGGRFRAGLPGNLRQVRYRAWRWYRWPRPGWFFRPVIEAWRRGCARVARQRMNDRNLSRTDVPIFAGARNAATCFMPVAQAQIRRFVRF